MSRERERSGGRRNFLLILPHMRAHARVERSESCDGKNCPLREREKRKRRREQRRGESERRKRRREQRRESERRKRRRERGREGENEEEKKRRRETPLAIEKFPSRERGECWRERKERNNFRKEKERENARERRGRERERGRIGEIFSQRKIFRCEKGIARARKRMRE